MTFVCRDWTTTLWHASYMGFAFFFENDDEEGGRSLKVHEFPGSDNPFVEDLGEKPRWFEGAAYVTGDDADVQAQAFASVLAGKGPGTLVVPILGPVLVHCDSFKRRADKDKLGYIAFSVKFVRDGAAGALVSVPLLSQNIFDAARNMVGALADVVPSALALVARADYVVFAAVSMVQTVAGSVELARAAASVGADISAQVHAALAAIVTAAPALISNDPVDPAAVTTLLASAPPLDRTYDDPVSTLAAVMVETLRLLGDGMAAAPDAGAGVLLGLALDFASAGVPTALSANAAAAAANSEAILTLARLAALTAWCEALARQSYPSRPDGVAARAAAAERLGAELGNAAGAANAPLYVALATLQGAVVQYLTRLIATLAPVVTVTAPQSMPSLWWSWRLYQDPSRAVDLVLRNAVTHPSFMPTTFAALAPGFAAPASLPTAWPAP